MKDFDESLAPTKLVYLLINSYRQGGAETVNLHLAGELARLGFRAHLVVLKGDGVPLEVPKGVEVHHMHLDGVSPRHLKNDKHPAVGALRGLFAATEGGECLQGALGAIGSLSLANKLLSFFPKEKVVFWLHFPVTYSDLQNKNWFRRVVRKRRLSQLYTGMKVAIPSQSGKRDFESIFGVGFSNIHAIYNPLSVHRINALAEVPIGRGMADSVEIDGDYWVHAGRFVEQKRHDRLLRAYKLFCERFDSNVKLVCLGDGPLMGEARELTESLGLNGRVVFLGYQSNPYPYIRKAKAFVLSSDFETLPTVLLEALALGVPCLSVRCPTGPDEILTGELSQWLVDLDEEALADGMQRMYENPPDVSGYDFSRFDPKQVAQQYIDLLKA